MRSLFIIATGQPAKNRQALEHSAKLRHNNNFDQSIRTTRRTLFALAVIALTILLHEVSK